MLAKSVKPKPVLALCLALAITGCSSRSGDLDKALGSITRDDLSADIGILASDEFGGRAPSTPGEEKTIAFLREEFEKLGLRPGNGQSYFQEIPLVEITADPGAALHVRGGEGTKRFEYGAEFVASTRHMVEREGLDGSEIIFVGYGITAPEYGWDDYKGIDVSGKTVVMLVNDPGFATKDPELFEGEAMTYYGRWTYKYEEATSRGAAGAFIVHETEPAAYPWAVVNNSFTGPQLNFATEDGNMSRVAVEGWLTVDAAREIFRRAGHDYDELKAAAARKDFSALPLGLDAAITLDNTVRSVVSNNVLGVLPGSQRKDEYIIYMAHWDHLGTDSSRTDDPVFNGALDNATGTAGLIEIAEAFTKLDGRPARSILFIALTGEEQGLLGSEYYAEHPLYPLDRTAAAINMDAMNILGRMKDVTAIGFGDSELDEYLTEAAEVQGRVVRPDPEPAKGSYFRSDHFSLARRGVPVLYAGGGTDHIEHGVEWTLEQRKKYIAARYHKPSDEFDSGWDLSGTIEDLRLLFMVGYRLAGESAFPQWREGVEFETGP